MIKIFRNLRKNTFMKGRKTQYLLYAIGEIVLVMIGILLALQVNNWNEKRKVKGQLNTTLKAITADLKADTLVSAQIIRFYDSVNKYSQMYAKGQITKTNIDSFPICRSLVTIYRPMTMQKKGFNLLQNYSEFTNSSSDSLLTDLSQFYAAYDAIITNNNDMVKSEVLENLNHFKKQPWFVDWSQGKLNNPMRTFFGESVDYKNRVVGNNILATSNHQAVLKQYRQDAISLLELIDQRLNAEN
ncbi:DUF6090 family protein [Ichthyenterobacterium sp. W332]|uniref:DUF6090 family protein n=1 Tax=Microcosmobacter mediterraneus TaxID=3075607 RepID=A0ABU2YGA8_9FLAO|nr:DUF6090 family protein [Ichthyenterobacterium sp. W332]MDT0557067.1 DUF6090 family protein [Ichthyenterobacterium sp. W332]